MTQPEEPLLPEPLLQPRPSWIRQHAVLAVILAGVIAASVAISGCGGSAVNKASNSVTTGSATPSALASALNAAAACNSSGGTWNGTSCDTSAPSSSPLPSGPAMLTVGQPETLQDTNSGATIGTLTVKSAQVTTQSADGSGNSPVNGYFVVVHVSAAADSSYTSGWLVSESDFYDLAGGHHYDNGNGNAFDALTSGQANSLETTLAAGETTDGWLSFDVSSRHGEIVYAPNSNGQPVAEWSY